ncbi:MAG: heparin lyase I family protein [Cyclobacteriaceae bacterium]
MILGFICASGSSCSQTSNTFRTWRWDQVIIPAYTWPRGTAFGDGLYVDAAFDPKGVQIVDEKLRFVVNPNSPSPPAGAKIEHNYRSEIRTVPWPIKHPLGTEQWIGFHYEFPDDYTVDSTSPIIIYQNHPGITGLPPQFELELAAFNRPRPAIGGEVQIVNHTNGIDPAYPHRGDRVVCAVKPLAGDTLKVVIHVVYGRDDQGLLQVWLNEQLYYDRQTSTVFSNYQWGGNNKWGIYNHTHKSGEDVTSSLRAGVTSMTIYMGTLKLLTRYPGQSQYLENAYNLVKP